jgi:hypothetical protein
MESSLIIPSIPGHKIQRMKKYPLFLSILIWMVLIAGCVPTRTTAGSVTQSIHVDGKEISVALSPSSTVKEALDSAGILLGELDRVSPPSYTILTSQTEIIVTRVTEEFSVKDVAIPFENQVIQNESLAEGESILIQPGVNGLEQITYRKVFEEGRLASTSVFSTSVISEAVPEITMVGISKPFTAVTIPGKIAYIVAGNAWLMEGSTENRYPVVSTGDLDGYVFNISLDGKWLLFTRMSSQNTDTLNSLWVVNLEEENATPYDLGVSNVVTHAAWMPGVANTLTYSTVEPRATAPGWQANNDLNILSFSDGGSVWRNENIIEANGGGEYGWWGTSYFWSPDGSTLLYSRPDGIGYVNFNSRDLVPSIQILPLNTHGDWAWVAQIGWAPSSNEFYYSKHQESLDVTDQETSPVFSIMGVNESDLTGFELEKNAGMFANPVPSPITEYGHFKVAYYSAIFPNQSDTSRYKLGLMDRDGSNRKLVFPSEGSAGMEPKKFSWAPDRQLGQPYYLAVLYQGNLWLIDSDDGSSRQITSDGLISMIDWK